ncbi:MAG: ferrous iron transport protein B [Eubacteriales bacterium]
MIFALAGNPNSGKTTLFNQLTGANQRTGNFPGVTIDQKSGLMKYDRRCTLVDLPGIYSLRPYSGEEVITRDFLLHSVPQGIINIVDATNLERNLYLTLQLLVLRIPMVVALNMMDEVRQNGDSIDTQKLSELLGVPVVPISASKNEGLEELTKQAIRVASKEIKPLVQDFCAPGPIHRCIHAVYHQIEDHAVEARLSGRFAAVKLIEGDEDILARLQLGENEKQTIEHLVTEMEAECGTDRHAVMAEMRYAYIESVCRQAVRRVAAESREYRRSVRLDRILTHRYLALPLFFGIMVLVFYLTFGVIGAALADMLESGIGVLTAGVDRLLGDFGLNPVLHSLIIDGIFAGVGSVLSFLPIIVVLFFFLSILEDSGYMARIAFVMDQLLRKIGLSGRSVVPLLIGFGCTIPALMATRTLSSERDRKMTILLAPFMSCSAKVPVYAVFAAAFFPRSAAWVMTGLYFGGILVAVLVALLLKRTAFSGNPVPFVMELPNYRFPSLKTTLRLIWDKAKDFLTRAFTIIFVATLVIWVLVSFDYRFNVVTDSSHSLLAGIGHLLVPLFAPLGFGHWQAVTALLSGLAAKEAVVSSLGVLLGVSAEGLPTVLAALFTLPAALSFLTFVLLYPPCVAAMAATRRELRSGVKTVGVVLSQCGIAWLASLLVYQVARLLF